MATTKSGLNAQSPSGGIVVYDGKCGICRRLAFKINNKSGDDVSVLPLKSQEAQELLERFYPNGPDYDFYFVSGSSCSKGLRAVPKIVQATGVREFGGLMKEYFDLKSLSGSSGDGSCGHDDTSTPATTSASGGSFSRRTFAGVAAAAATTLMSGTAAARQQKRTSREAPSDLEVRVATVTRDERGGFTTEIESRPDLIHEPPSFDGQAKKESDTEQASSLTRSTEETNLEKSTFGQEGQLSVDKVSSTYDLTDADARVQRAGKLQDGDDDVGRMDIYSGAIDAQRFELALNIGHGPVVFEDDTPGVGTTMSSKVQHDLAYPAVDFIVPNLTDASASEHIKAYAVGATTLQSFYNENGNSEMASVYGEVVEGLRETHASFADSVDASSQTPISSYLGVSGVPNFARYALPPEESQPPVTKGVSCDSGCGCGVEVCCGCGIGAGVCTTPVKLCGCCVLECSCDIISCCADVL